MSGDVPFGFTPEPDPEDPSKKEPGKHEPGKQEPGMPQDPFGFGKGFGSGSGSGGSPFGIPGMENMLGGFDMNQIGQAFAQFGAMLQNISTAPKGGDVSLNWDNVRDTARKTISAKGGDASVSDSERAAVADAARLADLWLDEVTTLPAGGVGALSWSRAEWLEATLPAWQKIIDPIAAEVTQSMTGLLPTGNESLDAVLPEEMRGMLPAGMDLSSLLGPLFGVVQQMGAGLFATQVGQALGELAGEVVAGSDAGVPVTGGQAALVMPNVRAFGEGLEIPISDVLLYLSLREIAHQRLFTHATWLSSRLQSAVAAYAAGIGVDKARIEDLVKEIDPTNPESLQQVLSGGVLEPKDTPEQKAALARLETLLALIEGWVDHVVTSAVADRMPQANALQEAVRRRRAAGGPAEKTFATLVGLELRPRRLRDAAKLWAELEADRGLAGRDAVWEHPDLLPTSEDLDDPLAFVTGTGISDADLSALTGEGPAEDGNETGSNETGSNETGSID